MLAMRLSTTLLLALVSVGAVATSGAAANEEPDVSAFLDCLTQGSEEGVTEVEDLVLACAVAAGIPPPDAEPTEWTDPEIPSPALPDPEDADEWVTDVSSAGYATCRGCRAWTHLTWYDHKWYEFVKVYRVQNTADESIDAQDAHGALLRGSGGCYTGGIRWSDSKVRYNHFNLPWMRSEDYYYGENKWWTLGTGHHWRDDGRNWRVGAGNDRCVKL